MKQDRASQIPLYNTKDGASGHEVVSTTQIFTIWVQMTNLPNLVILQIWLFNKLAYRWTYYISYP